MRENLSGLSRRKFVGGVGVGVGAIILDACSSSPSSKKTDSSDPVSADSNLSPSQQVLKDSKNLEPSTYAKTFVVDSAGAGTRSYRTIKDAFTAVAAAKAAALGMSSFVPAQSVPWVWHKVEIKPGDYNEALVVPPHTAVVGMGAHPDDVRIHWGGGDNVVETSGRSMYMKNVLLEHTSDDPSAHPMREAGPAGDAGLKRAQRRTACFESVHFKSAPTAPLGKCTNDMVPFGISIAFVDCVFDGPGQPQSINLVTDATNEMSGAIDVSFVGCKVISNHAQHPDKQINAQPGPAAPFGGPDAGNGRPDKVLWMNGSWDITKVYGVQGLLVLPLASIDDKLPHPAAGTRYYLVNEGSVPGVTTVKAAPQAHIEHSVPQGYRLPVGTFGPGEKKFFGEKPPKSAEHIVVGPQSTQTMQVKAGDIYWLPFEPGTRTLSIDTVHIDKVSAGSIAASVALEENGAPIEDGNGRTDGGAGKPGTGETTLSRRWFFPGQGSMWVGVAFTADAEVSACAAGSRGALKGSGYTAGSLIPGSTSKIAPQTLVPAVSLVSGLPQGFPQ